MKTAIQELMDIVEMDYYNGVEISMKVFNNMLKEALVKEKAQIVEAFKYAQVSHIMGDELRAEQYYHNVFKHQIEPNF